MPCGYVIGHVRVTDRKAVSCLVAQAGPARAGVDGGLLARATPPDRLEGTPSGETKAPRRFACFRARTVLDRSPGHAPATALKRVAPTSVQKNAEGV